MGNIKAFRCNCFKGASKSVRGILLVVLESEPLFSTRELAFLDLEFLVFLQYFFSRMSFIFTNIFFYFQYIYW